MKRGGDALVPARSAKAAAATREPQGGSKAVLYPTDGGLSRTTGPRRHVVSFDPKLKKIPTLTQQRKGQGGPNKRLHLDADGGVFYFARADATGTAVVFDVAVPAAEYVPFSSHRRAPLSRYAYLSAHQEFGDIGK